MITNLKNSFERLKTPFPSISLFHNKNKNSFKELKSQLPLS